MGLEYFEHRICDELEDSKHYAKMAIEIKAMNSNWPRILFDMSSSELSHAEKLYSMFQEYYKIVSEAYKEIPECIEHCYKRVSENYTTLVPEIRWLHEAGNK